MSPERIVTPVELAADIMADARAVVRALPEMETISGAVGARSLLDRLIASAQTLRGRAVAVIDSDAQVEAAAEFDEVWSHLDEDGAS